MNDPCSECLEKLKALHDATIKLNEIVHILAQLADKQQESSAAFREQVETLQREHQEAATDLDRHRASHDKGSAAKA